MACGVTPHRELTAGITVLVSQAIEDSLCGATLVYPSVLVALQDRIDDAYVETELELWSRDTLDIAPGGSG